MNVDVPGIIQAALAIAQELLPWLEKLATAIFGG